MATAAIHLLSLPAASTTASRVFAAVVQQVTLGGQGDAGPHAPAAPVNNIADRARLAKGWHVNPARHCAIYAAAR